MAYVVLYRTGGTARWTWHSAFSVANKAAAQVMAADVQTQGYEAHIEDAARAASLGLPTKYRYNGKERGEVS